MFKRKRTKINSKVRDLTPREAYDIIKNNKSSPDFIILDLRTPEEYQKSHLYQAKLLNYYRNDFQEELLKMDKSKKYLIYCRTGVRSAKTLNLMSNADFIEVYNILGGITQWIREGLPIETLSSKNIN